MRNETDAFGADDNEMRESLNSATAERLLDGTADTPPALAALLAQAAAPGRPIELTGEAMALAAFRAAPAPVGSVPLRTPSRARRRWLIAAAAATFTFASAGVAVAAATGILPSPLRPAATTEQPSKDTSSREGPPSDGRGNGPTAPPPAEAIPGLCRAYLAQLAAGHDDELRNPRFVALAELAGGADRVAAYCEELLAEPSPKPTHGRPDPHPTKPLAGQPTELPTGQQPNKPPAK